MLRTLLVVDEYTELMYLQTLLKKLGFDVEGLQKSTRFSATLLGFNPQVVIISTHNGHTGHLPLINQIKKRNGWPKIVVLKAAGVSVDGTGIDFAQIDDVIPSPISMQRLLETIAAYDGLDSAMLIEKYQKMKKTQPEEEVPMGSMSLEERTLAARNAKKGAPPPKAKEPEVSKYKKFTEKSEAPPPDRQTFNRQQVVKSNRKNRTAEEIEKYADLDEERKRFVKSLFTSTKE